MTASGGSSPYTFSKTSGTLPTGLTLSTAGVLSGTPTATGSFTFTVQAKASNNCTGTRSYTVAIACPTITVNPSTLPNGTTTASYSQTITASGGTSPYTFTKTSGSLPGGLTLSTAGVLSGTPSAGGSFTFTIQAKASNGCTGTRSYTLTIACPTITVNPSTLPNGTTTAAYSQTITASGGSSPYTFTVSSGSLPGGLTLTTAGVLSGTPSASGTFTFTIQAKDNKQCTGTRSYTLTIACPTITVNPSTLANGKKNTAYNKTITASGGTSPYTFSKTSGSLPGGLTLSTAGVLSGTPTASGTFTFTVQAKDYKNCTGTRSYGLVITN